MKVGIISDTHDNLSNITTAGTLLNDEGVSFFIHAGDYVAPFSVRAFLKVKGTVPFAGVFGNCDGDSINIAEVAQGCIYQPPYVFDVDGKRVFLIHDIEHEDIETLSNEYDIIIHGHTHEPEIRKLNRALIINPGECCGIITGVATVAVLDTGSMEAKIITLP